MRLGNVSGAIDQLKAVSDLQQDQAAIALELARLLQGRGDFTGARQYIDRATRSKTATIQDMRQAASLLALQGDYTTALALLEKAFAGTAQQPPDLVLAALYRQLNQPQKTDAICRQLLEKPDAATIAFCADFYASQNRADEAQRALTLLDGLKLNPGAKELILADYATRHGSQDQALKQFQAAAQAAPTEAVAWQQLIAYCLGAGKIDEALAAADQATQKLADKTGFEALCQNAALVKDAARVTGTRQLLMMLTGPSAGNEPVLDALRIVVAAQQQKEPPRLTATKLRQLADRNPRVLPLQTITLQFYMDAGQADEAVSMATRAVQSFPATVDPLRLATSVLGAAQQWNQALGTAKEWKRLGTGETLDADLAIASAELHLGDASAASQQIQPYLERALLDPEKFSGVILLRSQGLLASHQPAEVETLLGPLLPKSVQWRNLWLSLAVRGVDDPSRASAWLDQVTPVIAADLNEKTSLAQAWMAIGKRWSNSDFDLKGRKLLEAIVQAPDAPVKALLVWGTLCEASSDWTGAERTYRQALQRDPAAAIALNNLADVLVKSRGNLQESQQLIAKALVLFPNEPAFLDTKAAVQAALKDYTGAAVTLREAQRLDPKNVEWHISLLAVLIDSGQPPAARIEMQQITTLLAASPNLTPELRQRYDALRAKLQ
jgi:tetratricopeptide (TPR) repeat protein